MSTRVKLLARWYTAIRFKGRSLMLKAELEAELESMLFTSWFQALMGPSRVDLGWVNLLRPTRLSFTANV